MATYKVKRDFGIDNITARRGEEVELTNEQAKAVAEFVTKAGKGGSDNTDGGDKAPTVAELKAELKELGVDLNGATKLADLQALLDEAKANAGNAPA